jgi:hypothetical protein
MFLADQLSSEDEQRLKQLMVAVCDLYQTERGRVFRGEVAPSIGLNPDYNLEDAIEFRNLARILKDRGYIENRRPWGTTYFEVFQVTDYGLRACEEGTI